MASNAFEGIVVPGISRLNLSILTGESTLNCPTKAVVGSDNFGSPSFGRVKVGVCSFSSLILGNGICDKVVLGKICFDSLIVENFGVRNGVFEYVIFGSFVCERRFFIEVGVGSADSWGTGIVGIFGNDGVGKEGVVGNDGVGIDGVVGSEGVEIDGVAGSCGIDSDGFVGDGIATEGIVGIDGIEIEGASGSDGIEIEDIAGSVGFGNDGVGIDGIAGSDGMEGRGRLTCGTVGNVT
jgi:hypothetical protein